MKRKKSVWTGLGSNWIASGPTSYRPTRHLNLIMQINDSEIDKRTSFSFEYPTLSIAKVKSKFSQREMEKHRERKRESKKEVDCRTDRASDFYEKCRTAGLPDLRKSERPDR